jgi:hypothetical protein
LPQDIRIEINRRLDDGATALDVASWLNSEKKVRKVHDEKWPGQPRMSVKNIHAWRRGGYQQWLQQREKLDHLKELSEYSLRLGQAAGGSVADGSAAIAGGRIMEALETTSDEDIHKMVRSICNLRTSDIRKVQAAQNDKKIAQADQKLELERKRYQRQTAQLFIEWHGDKRAREIVESRDGNAEKLEKLGRAIFGEDW